MKKILMLLLFLSPYTLFSQSKKIVFADENLKILTKNDFFNNPLKKDRYILTFENDSSTIKVKVDREKYGRLTKNRNRNIRSYLETLSSTKIDSTKTVIINYFPTADKCQGKSNWNKFFIKKCNNFVNQVKKNEKLTQYFIFKDKSSVKNFKKKFKWYLDTKQLIEKTFFKYHYPCFSYVIIKPNGNYYTVRGEYNISEIYKKIKH